MFNSYVNNKEIQLKIQVLYSVLCSSFMKIRWMKAKYESKFIRTESKAKKCKASHCYALVSPILFCGCANTQPKKPRTIHAWIMVPNLFF